MNRLFLYIFLFSFILTISITNSTIISPTKVINYLPITFHNSQNSVLAYNTTLPIGVVGNTISTNKILGFNALNYKNYETCNLQNTIFFYSNGTVIPSFLEGNIINESKFNGDCSNTLSNSYNLSYSNNISYWVKIGKNANLFLPANTGTATSNTIYIGFTGNVLTSTNDIFNTTDGQAPQLSCNGSLFYGNNCASYGENANGTYDISGTSVFPVFDGFDFTSTPSSTGVWSFDPYIYINVLCVTSKYGLQIHNCASTGSNLNPILNLTTPIKYPEYLEGLIYPTKISNVLYGNAGISSISIYNNHGRFLLYNATNGNFINGAGTSGSETTSTFSNSINQNNYVFSILDFKNNIDNNDSINYNIGSTTVSSVTDTNPFMSLIEQYANSNTGFNVTWIRERIPPPLNVSPTTTYGSVSSTPYPQISANVLTIDNGQSVGFTSSITSGTSPYTYQWYSGSYSSCSSDSSISGATSSTYTASPSSSTYYCLLVTDSNSNAEYSSSIHIIVNQKPLSDGFTASNTIIDEGQTQVLTATLTGGTSPYTYNFLVYNPTPALETNALYSTSSTTNSFSYIQNSAWGTGTFTANIIITDNVGEQTTNSLTYSVNTALGTPTISPSNPTIDNGQSISFTSTWSGGTTDYTAKLYSSSTSTCNSGSTLVQTLSSLTSGSASFSSISPSSTTYYCIFVTDSATTPETTNSVNSKVIVNPALGTPTLSPTSYTMDSGENSPITSTETGGTTPYNYQWYKGSTGLGTLISGATASTYQPTATGSYYVSVTDSATTPETENSLSASVTVNPALLSCPSYNDTACYPIYINNTQSSATGNDFQQMINITKTSFTGLKYNTSYANFEYTYKNGTVIPAWIESNTSDKLITWLNISSGLSANSNTLIYLNIKHTNQLNSTGLRGIGEAPQLSSSYAKYDDGMSVFNNYYNFAGTTLPSGLTTYRSSYTVSNGITITSGTYVFAPQTTYPKITETLIPTATSSSTQYIDIGESTTTNLAPDGVPYSGYSIELPNAATGDGIELRYESSSGGASVSGTSFTLSNNAIYSFAWVANGNQKLYYNYQSEISGTNTTETIGNYYPYIGLFATLNHNFFQWFRTRSYPPNGVMPSVSFGSSLSPTTVNKTSVDNGQKVSITANWQGGTQPYTLKLYYTPKSATSCYYDGVPITSTSTSSNTYTFTESPLSSGYYCVNITDSATTPVNSLTATNTIAFYQSPEINTGYNITIENTQTSAISANTQILISANTLKFSGVNANTYNNIELSYNGTLLNSWIESNSVASNITLWTKLPVAIPASSNVVIKAIIGSNNLLNAQTTGEAPQLSSVYAKYDNGENIFNFYDNFIGTTLNTALWNPLSYTSDASYTINNGITFTLTASSNNIALYSLNTYNPENYIEEQGIRSLNIPILDSEYTADWFINKPSNIGAFTGDYRFELLNTGSILQYRMCNDMNGCGLASGSVSETISNIIFGALWQSTGNEYIYNNYIKEYSYGNSGSSITPSYIGTQFNTYTNAGTITGTLNYIRLREYPPNGVLPTIITTNTITDGFTASYNSIYINQTQILTANVVGGASPYTYNFLVYNSIGDLVTNDLVTNSLTTNSFSFKQLSSWGTGNFIANVIITDNNGEQTSNSLTYSAVYKLITNKPKESNSIVDLGQSSTLTANFSGGTSPYTYQWYFKYAGQTISCNSGAISGATSNPYTITPLGYYINLINLYYKVTDSSSPTQSSCSNATTLFINNYLNYPILNSTNKTYSKNQQVIINSSGTTYGLISDSSNANITILDTNNNTLIGSEYPPQTPNFMASSPNYNNIYFTTTSSDLYILNLTSFNQTTAVSNLTNTEGVVISPNNSDVFVISGLNGANVIEISTSTNKFVKEIYNANANTLRGISILPNNKDLFVASQSGNGKIIEINISTGNIVKNITTYIHSPYGIAVTPNGKDLYVVNQLGTNLLCSPTNCGNVTVYNTSTGAFITSITNNINTSLEVAFTPNGKYAYVTDQALSPSYITEINTTSYATKKLFSTRFSSPISITIPYLPKFFGTVPYTYNYTLYNSTNNVVYNKIFTNIPLSTNTIKYIQNSAWGTGNFTMRLKITDSATTPTFTFTNLTYSVSYSVSSLISSIHNLTLNIGNTNYLITNNSTKTINTSFPFNITARLKTTNYQLNGSIYIYYLNNNTYYYLNNTKITNINNVKNITRLNNYYQSINIQPTTNSTYYLIFNSIGNTNYKAFNNEFIVKFSNSNNGNGGHGIVTTTIPSNTTTILQNSTSGNIINIITPPLSCNIINYFYNSRIYSINIISYYILPYKIYIWYLVLFLLLILLYSRITKKTKDIFDKNNNKKVIIVLILLIIILVILPYLPLQIC